MNVLTLAKIWSARLSVQTLWLLMLSSSWHERNSAISALLNTYNSQPMKILSERASSLPEGVRRLF